MRLDPESRALSGASAFIAFVALNVVYLVCCLPVVTIGMATSALFEVMLRYSDDERGSIVKDFFPAMGRNALRGTVVFLALGLPMTALLFAGTFWIASSSIVSGAAAIVAFLGALYLFGALLHGLGLVANFHTTIPRTLKNALLLPAAEPLRTGALVLIPLAVVAITAVFPVFIVILLTIAFSFGAYGAAFVLRGVYARHLAE